MQHIVMIFKSRRRKSILTSASSFSGKPPVNMAKKATAEAKERRNLPAKPAAKINWRQAVRDVNFTFSPGRKPRVR